MESKAVEKEEKTEVNYATAIPTSDVLMLTKFICLYHLKFLYREWNRAGPMATKANQIHKGKAWKILSTF